MEIIKDCSYIQLFFDEVPETGDEQHQLGQKQQTFWVGSPTGEMQFGRTSQSGRKSDSACAVQVAFLQPEVVTDVGR